MGIVAEIIANNTRKPLWGYRSMVYSLVFLGFMSFIVWAHHMFMTGMGTAMAAFFQTTTMIISIPSVVILTALIISLWGGSIRFNTPMLFALAFLPMFGIGGLTGLPLGLNVADIPLHDTYYVIAHFHYVVAPGTIFALFAGIYYWYPKATGRKMNETLGKIHFLGSFVCMNVVFMPMFFVGLAGVSRRLYDGGAAYALCAAGPAPERRVLVGRVDHGALPDSLHLQFLLEHPEGGEDGREPLAGHDDRVGGSLASAARQFPRGPAGVPRALRIQRSRRGQGLRAAVRGLIEMDIPYTVELRRDTGLNNGKIGIWLFLASEVMLFGALFASYILIRTGTPSWPRGDTILNVPLATFNTLVLISSSVTMVMAWASLMRRRFGTFRIYMGATILLGFVFLVVKYFEYSHKFETGLFPSTNNFLALYFTLTGLHMLHVFGGMAVNAYSWGPARSSGRRTRSGSPTASRTRASSGISWIWSGSSCSRPCISCRRASMTSDHAVDIDKHVRIYITVFVALMVLTIVTVAVSRFHLPVPIGRDRGADRRDHQGIAGGVLLHAPDLREEADLRGPRADRCLLHRAAGPSRRHRPRRLLDSLMNLRWVHAMLILFSAALAVLFGVWCLGLYGREDGVASLVAAVAAFAVSFGLVVYDSWFLRKTRTLR